MSIRLLAAGACYNDDAFGRCALQPNECSASQTYRSSRWMTINDSPKATQCANQASIHNIPAMGRCDAESERFICTSHKSACFIDVSFQDLDSDCTVLDDFRPVDTPFTRSYFGECVATDQGEAQGLQDYCAWQFSECPTGGTYIFETADEFFAGRTPSCQCDQVRTGACVSTGQSSDFFCAISERVCATETGFEYLKAFEVEETLGTVCMLCDTLPSGPQTRYAQAGACIVSATNVFERCALLPSHCDGQRQRFVSPQQLRQSPSLFPDMAQGCLVEQGLHQVRIGRCASDSDQHICTSDATACKLSQSFQPNDDECRLVQDLNPSLGGLSTSHFGHCTATETTTFSGYQADRESYCAWSFDACQSSDPNGRPLLFGGANPGLAAAFPTCQCDDVRIGACVDPDDASDLYCAVDESACNDGWEYHNVRSLESPSGQNTICFLCQPLPRDDPSGPSSGVPAALPSPPVPNTPQSPPSRAPPESPAGAPTLKELEQDPWAVGAVVGIVLAVVCATCLLGSIAIGVGMRIRRSQQDPRKASNDDHDATGPAAVVIEQGQTEEDFVAQEGRDLT